MNKTCSKCGLEKALLAFSKQKLGKFGRRANCKECGSAYEAARRLLNIERDAVRHARYRQENRDVCNARTAACRAANPEYYAARTKAWNKAHPEVGRVAVKAWAERNRSAVLAANARRRAARQRAVPAWFGEIDEFVMAEAADLAGRRTTATKYPWHVDHVVPLRSKLVCGLHVCTNMQVIPATVNISKGNRYWPDMP